MEIQTLTSPSIFRFFWTVLMMLLLHEQTAYLFSTCHAREFWNFWVVNSLGEDLMKSVNWWESPCPEWDCFWHDKMQMNAASAGLIWLAGLELSQDALKLWAPGSCCSRQPASPSENSWRWRILLKHTQNPKMMSRKLSLHYSSYIF